MVLMMVNVLESQMELPKEIGSVYPMADWMVMRKDAQKALMSESHSE